MVMTAPAEEKTCGEREKRRVNGERQCHNEAAQPMLTSRVKSLNVSSTSQFKHVETLRGGRDGTFLTLAASQLVAKTKSNSAHTLLRVSTRAGSGNKREA